MKGVGGGVGGVSPAKRRWRSLVIGVLFLVVLSMLVPLGFLLGLHNGFHSHGFVPIQHTSQSNVIGDFDRYGTRDFWNHSQGASSNHIDDLLRQIEPKLPKVRCMTPMMTSIAYTLLFFIFCYSFLQCLLSVLFDTAELHITY
ncbi:hypothetical protein SLEP1_g15254 [Rubroshorea leprosula]|uniref:Uncharacterized protein n=1 Tax=Rubroshorea leprosula TaxID=152421 RepID=A0AAV5ILR6_9ROSI|nr:hypothetical protein SLEP1_g15254 [Rubroshorea leprosula]